MSVNSGCFKPGVSTSPATQFKKGSTPWNKGKPHMQKENHPLWAGGYTPIVRVIRGCSRYNTWRLDVFRRDKKLCQICGSSVNIEAHHIVKFMVTIRKYDIRTLKQALDCSELWDVKNGITICKKCHKENADAR